MAIMQKKLLAFVAAAVIACLPFAGCAQAVDEPDVNEPAANESSNIAASSNNATLGRELPLGSIGDAMVPSDWAELVEESLVGKGATYAFASPDAGTTLVIECIDYADEIKKDVLVMSPNEAADASMDIAKEEHPDATDWDRTLMDQRSIDGAACEVYDVRYDIPDQGGQTTVHSYEAFLTKGDVTASIKSSDEDILFAVLDSIR